MGCCCKSKGDNNSDIVLQHFKSAKEPMKAGDIAEACGLDKKEVDGIIKKLKDEGKIESPKRCFYAIKK